jgi:glycosyltransferase involved in cell wall biosynthesis
MKPLKTTLINTDDHTGGAAIACRRLLKALQAHTQVNAQMLVQESRSGQKGINALDNFWFQKKKSLVRFIAERLTFLPFEKNRDVRFLFNVGFWGRNISNNKIIQQSNVVHLHWINFGFLSIKSIEQLLKTQKPIVWTLHDMWAFTGGCHHSGECENYQLSCGNCQEFMNNPISNDLSNRVWESKNHHWQNGNLTIVTCSEWLAQRARKSSLFKNRTVVSIPNPIDTSVFVPLPKHEARKELKLSTSKKYILFTAMRIDAPKKGFSYFKEALEILAKDERFDNSTTELLIFGQADQTDFESLPLKVNFLGKLNAVEQIVRVYSSASVFVTPSLEENLPNTIMEALACGTPAVGFAVGGIPEMIDHNQNGYLAIYKDSRDLAKGIKQVLESIDYESLSQNARHKVMGHYSEEVVATRYANLYEQLTQPS